MKKVLMIGCSFFDRPGYWPWLATVEEKLELEIDLISHDGFGNKRILHSLLDKLSQHTYDYVIISFSGFDRDEIIIPQSNLDWFTQVSVHKDIDKFLWYSSGGYGGNYTQENDRNLFKNRYRYAYRFTDLVKINASYIISAQSILQNMQIPYTFCFYSNQLENFNFLTGCQLDNLSERQYISFKKLKSQITCLNLIDFEKFWLYDNKYSKYCGIEEYISDLGFIDPEDNHHPLPRGTKKLFLDELLPKILQSKTF